MWVPAVVGVFLLVVALGPAIVAGWATPRRKRGKE